jgi:hypothetical protein
MLHKMSHKDPYKSTDKKAARKMMMKLTTMWGWGGGVFQSVPSEQFIRKHEGDSDEDNNVKIYVHLTLMIQNIALSG